MYEMWSQQETPPPQSGQQSGSPAAVVAQPAPAGQQRPWQQLPPEQSASLAHWTQSLEIEM